MKEKIEQIKSDVEGILENAKDIATLEQIRIKYLGKKGELTAVLKGMGKLSKEERPVIGALANEVRSKLETELEEKRAQISKAMEEAKLKNEVVDVTMPGKKAELGKLHPLTKVMNEIKDIFKMLLEKT